MSPTGGTPTVGTPSPPCVTSSQTSMRKKEPRVVSNTTTSGTSVSMSKKAADDAMGSAASLSSGDLFVRNLSIMSVAHIARGVGFDAIQKSAADVLAEILGKCIAMYFTHTILNSKALLLRVYMYYIQRIGGAAKELAELAGRAHPKATDVMQAFHDLAPAAVEMNDLIKTLESVKRPFPRDVPRFPARKRDISGNTIEQTTIGRREGLPPHVPTFLPPLPNRHTYSSESRLVVEREQDLKRQRLGLLSEKAHVRQSLHGLQTVAARYETEFSCANAEKPMAMVRQPTWNAFQGATGTNAMDNPFVQAPVVLPSARDTLFSGPDRTFVPKVENEHAKNQLNNNVTIPKLTSQDQGKEEKIMAGTFHDGDSE
ncbi:hypothetical protein CCR75_001102 [Bremia lactucae]|uniref:Transcription initiation factor TFIID subunit 8 n=1 Tax=Bremia lactucae TaxID=4779 RepID=A0A976FRK4_BRELC|nr:hypothetical protein CCR75_001102 [Bremia lactucae]